MAEDSPQDAKKTLDYLVERIDLYLSIEVEVLMKFTFDGADKLGAEGGTLAKLLAADFSPETWVPSKAQYELGSFVIKL
jgi:hypothetical protein